MNRVKVAAVCLLAGLVSIACAEPRFDDERQVWALSIDNDFFAPGQTDRDFTGGLAITYSGFRGLRFWRPLDRLLAWTDEAVGADNAMPEPVLVTPSIELGSYGFTPDDIESPGVVVDDRPYASLVYFTAGRTYWDRISGDAWTSSLTFGVLGLDVFESGQRQAHRIFGNKDAAGWAHQISDGGEPTLRYHLAFHDSLLDQSPSAKLKATYYLSLGYLTEAGLALSYRNGLISSPDHRFNPELTFYGERVSEGNSGSVQGNESYFWGGLAIKARAYNVFLQGQFRDSDHTLDRDDVRWLLAEAWVGYTASLGRDYSLSYLLRAQSSEIYHGQGDRALVWGGLVLSRVFR
ncbi:lipid A deacylase LpxR family protein [Marinobacter zhejiangensis]|uniref:Lipid A deacylase LpxR family protein n=1 Tax=Marinobacter zhejiangensis TaxID=488535 RepID=A0A1I4QTN6_9GAMM|nr:lipid A deacylase LpxR family protein [Marinobacter zhejiangensis]SFM43391.1 hypothetical protein SAMN04487963_2571 [Marinobacter zhejiangensis]